MSEAIFFRIRVYVTATAAIAIWSWLAWNHYHGGVPRHHILADKDLPEISNLWAHHLERRHNRREVICVQIGPLIEVERRVELPLLDLGFLDRVAKSSLAFRHDFEYVRLLPPLGRSLAAFEERLHL